MPSIAGILAPIEWLPGGRVRLIDQTRLPREEAYLETSDYRDLARAIREMRVRGAPLIGITAAYALALAARQAAAGGKDVPAALREAAAELRATRPTASNLAWALERMLRLAEEADDADAARRRWRRRRVRIHQEDIAACRRIGANGGGPAPGRRLAAHPLQHRLAGHRRLRHRAGRGPRRLGAGQAASMCTSRRRGRSCRARGSPPGSSSATASPSRSSWTAPPDSSCVAAWPRPSWSAPTASPPTATSPTRSAPTRWRCWPARTACRSTSPRRPARSISARPAATRSPSRSAPPKR